jgi:hypothetical protein
VMRKESFARRSCHDFKPGLLGGIDQCTVGEFFPTMRR